MATLRPTARSLADRRGARKARRRGAVSTLDYVLVLVVMLPMVVLVMFASPRMIRAVYEMLCVMISWPFP